MIGEWLVKKMSGIPAVRIAVLRGLQVYVRARPIAHFPNEPAEWQTVQSANAIYYLQAKNPGIYLAPIGAETEIEFLLMLDDPLPYMMASHTVQYL